MEQRWRRAGRRRRLDAEEERRFSPGRDAARGSARPGGITRMRQGARAVRPARRAGPGRSTANRGGARGRGPAGDPRAAGGGGGAAAHERGRASRGRGRGNDDVDLNSVIWGREEKGLVGKVSAGWSYQPALTCPYDISETS